ncbi:MAG: UDP-N-acetylmuramoyl-L-alanine--D-glutamate ligase [Acidimicrobiia bacterium]|nr:UDP-N-acetylmuramoyl-L-alanine--D-glutamate ligase [Acidimicrobiia bacterium]
MRVLVLGGAVSGLAAARLATSRGEDVAVYDRRAVAVPDCEVHTGEWDPTLLAGVDLVVTSPGFPEHVGPVRDVIAAGVRIVSEMEYAMAGMDVPYAAVTGTNGKTTVTALAADMLTASCVDAVAAGNIGNALSDLVADPPAVLVIEASSFQLRFIESFHPRAAAILNIAPDHLDWHRDLAEYTAAKQRIFANQTATDILVYDADDEGAAAAVTPARSKLVPVSGRVAGPLLIAGDEVPNPGFDRAYTVDLLAAGELAAYLGATPEGIAATIDGFVPGEHRRTVIGRWDGVTWVNDSKATNPHAAVASIGAYPSVVLIAGGRNKGLDLRPIAAVPTLRHTVGIGEAAEELGAVTDPGRFVVAADLEDAVAVADGLATDGDTVLLAPGCASFDMFTSYGERGREFTRLVRERKGEDDGN